ncbi:hypothetical protein SMALA_8473 [Streptomyces malaysiensis subsp. malaysiensis]|nr:hypothetical protein SMALA_8473 [Streptomyces malaysiensis]
MCRVGGGLLSFYKPTGTPRLAHRRRPRRRPGTDGRTGLADGNRSAAGRSGGDHEVRPDRLVGMVTCAAHSAGESEHHGQAPPAFGVPARRSRSVPRPRAPHPGTPPRLRPTGRGCSGGRQPLDLQLRREADSPLVASEQLGRRLWRVGRAGRSVCSWRCCSQKCVRAAAAVPADEPVADDGKGDG